MPYPKYRQIDEPLLKYIFLNGNQSYEIEPGNTYEPLADLFRLTQEERERRKENGDFRWKNMVQWAKDALKREGYIERNRKGKKVWSLTPSGVERAEQLLGPFSTIGSPDNFKHDLVAADMPNLNESTQPYERAGRRQQTINRIIRDTKLAKKIKNLHQNECQICGKSLRFGRDVWYSEAHHIRPLGGDHNGPDIASNILCLCPDHHAMVDYGAVSLDIRKLKTHPLHLIDPDFIDYHNLKIYKAP